MALVVNERIQRFVEYTDNYGSFRSYLLGSDQNRLRRDAEYHVQQGHTNVAVVTERVRWRGKNGKQTKEEIDRESFS
jgi:hypothetical protein